MTALSWGTADVWVRPDEKGCAELDQKFQLFDFCQITYTAVPGQQSLFFPFDPIRPKRSRVWPSSQSPHRRPGGGNLSTNASLLQTRCPGVSPSSLAPPTQVIPAGCAFDDLILPPANPSARFKVPARSFSQALLQPGRALIEVRLFVIRLYGGNLAKQMLAVPIWPGGAPSSLGHDNFAPLCLIGPLTLGPKEGMDKSGGRGGAICQLPSLRENRFRRTSAEDEELVQRSLIGHFSDELACGVSTALPRLLIPRRRGTFSVAAAISGYKT
ncbi:hypothetical protein CSOJ01_09789 [Colletotrichum sojae]|uniref:Uncharacterized protein n=1 Tax=Colletotrichum sojae TaxID=2175907 RepID=A0A8H6J255_9PEZI|nr:hypothetical protein CSOJ01_09789 [Colletotrichum sojae]